MPEEMVLRIWWFWKRVCWKLTLERGVECWGFGCRVEEWNFSDPYRQEWIEILNTTRWGAVSIVRLRKTFKNCVSLLVSKNRNQKLIKPFVPEQQRTPLFWISKCICITVMQLKQDERWVSSLLWKYAVTRYVTPSWERHCNMMFINSVNLG